MPRGTDKTHRNTHRRYLTDADGLTSRTAGIGGVCRAGTPAAHHRSRSYGDESAGALASSSSPAPGAGVIL